MGDAFDLVLALTERQLRVLAVLWEHKDHSAGDLARLLYITEACVRFHLHNIYKRLGVSGKVELLMLCKEAGFEPMVSRIRG